MSSDVPPLEEPYWSPPRSHNTQLLQNDTEIIIRDPRFSPIVENMPSSECTYCMTMMGKSDMSDKEYMHLKIGLTMNRISNRICNNQTCFDKSNPSSLRWCSKCKMAFYCSEDCQVADWPIHKKWCCRPEAERDTGPMMTAILKRSEPLKQSNMNTD